MMNGPDLQSYDLILCNTSAGKDSQVCLDEVVKAAAAAGVLDRVVAVHADLGRVEWEGTKELAEEQASHYGVPFVVVRNSNHADLLARIENRGSWPDMKNRYCTSEFKTGVVRKLMTALVALHRSQRGLNPNGRDGAPTRILNCLGLRAQESRSRAAKPAFAYDEASSNTKRHVDEWLPVHDWSVEQVWDRIHASGVPFHPAYSLSMPRLSCVFCVFASKEALTVAIRQNPKLADDYVAAERRMGHTFTARYSFESVVDAARAADAPTDVVVPDWAA